MAMEYRHTIKDAHPKPVLCLQYNSFRRELYTAGEDPNIRVWESESGKLINTWVQHTGWTGAPVYSLGYNARRQQMMAGQMKFVRLYQMIGEEVHGIKEVMEKRAITLSAHNDIVNCIVACEGRFYSAGYDRKIIIYEAPHHGDLKLKAATTIKDAHDAAISCMVFGRDADNSWLITGSVDRVVKLWSLDGNLIQRFDGFSDTISSICYVIPTQTLWITANSPFPIVYDPRSGINVSDFVRTDDERFHPRGGPFGLKSIQYVQETNEVIGISSRKSLVVWRYNSAAPLTILPGHDDIVECLAFSPKEPILIFSGGDDGMIRKWERLQLNAFMFSQETLILPKEEYNEPMRMVKETTKVISKRPVLKYFTTPKLAKVPYSRQKTPKAVTSAKLQRPGVVCLCYHDELELLVSGYEDSKIRIWGYQVETTSINPSSSTENSIGENPSEAVTSRVAGMCLKATLTEHRDAVVALVSIHKDSNHWLLSTGWDRRILLWNLKEMKLHDYFKNTNDLTAKEELAADGLILGIDYNPTRNEFGYCSTDKSAYIRKFSTNGAEMKLVAVLQGHEAEVNVIKWHAHSQQWITGSEDRTLRIWPAEGIPCIRTINNDGNVTALCFDAINGCIITGSQDKIIRVFDTDKKDEIVQKNSGHTDEIRAIIHIPTRNQYVSASWDNSVRIWNAYFKKGQRKIVKETTAKYVPEEEEAVPSYSDLNPLIVPKLLMKPLFVKEFVLEKAQAKEEEVEETAEKTAIEEELRQTLNDLDAALNSPEKMGITKSNVKSRLKSIKVKRT